jgi:regulatory protein
MTGQRKGKLWIRQELRQKGIANELIVEALEGVDADVEFETALTAGRKKWNQVKGDVAEKKRKTLPFLMRRGFPMDMVRKVVNCLIEEDEVEDSEDDELLPWD